MQKCYIVDDLVVVQNEKKITGYKTMPICEGCGGSFAESIKFCPNCGREKTIEPINMAPSYFNCLKCGARNDVSVNFCQNCGASNKQKCKQCGSSNSYSVNFCGNCGAKLSEIKFTISEELLSNFLENRKNHPGLMEIFSSVGAFQTKYRLATERINKALEWPYRVSFGNDNLYYLFPIDPYDWSVRLVNYNENNIRFGMAAVDRVSLILYNFDKSSRTIFFFEDFLSVRQNGDTLILNFKKSGEMGFHFGIPTPSTTNFNALKVIGIGTSILGDLISSAVFNETETERQIKLLREDVRRADPNYMTNAEAAQYEHDLRVEAAATFIPLHKILFEGIINEKKSRGLI